MKFNHKVIKEYREKRGLTQEGLMIELANNGCKVSLPSIVGWENDSVLPKADALAALANVLGISVKNFFIQDTN